MMGFWFPLLLVLVVATLPQSQAFSSPILQQQPQQRCFPSIVIMEKRTSWMKMSTDSAAAEQQQDQSESSNSSSNNLPDIPSMRVKEIQAELKERSVSYADCFDKESLAKRLQEARENPEAFAKKEAPTPQVTKDGRTSSGAEKNTSTSTATSDNSANSNNNNKTLATKKKKDFNREETLSELRAMKVRELREACAKRQIRWGQFVEKEDFIQALIVAMENAADFSVSGQMEAGKVTELTGDQLEQELSQPSEAPLLLDIFATWCGPCQMMAPHLEASAAELGDKIRVGKIDSDKYPAMAQKLKAGGVPTVLILNGNDELQRIEGAMMKDQILRFVEPYI